MMGQMIQLTYLHQMMIQISMENIACQTNKMIEKMFFFDRKRILEELDQVLVDLTDKNQLTSEEDDCCVKNVSIQEAEYMVYKV